MNLEDTTLNEISRSHEVTYRRMLSEKAVKIVGFIAAKRGMVAGGCRRYLPVGVFPLSKTDKL